MNCKQGDLVRFVGKIEPELPVKNIYGWIGRCVEFVHDEVDGWMVDPPIDGVYNWCKDSALRPIDNPGDDEVDETLLRNPVEEMA